jgi:hypothetical protein
MIDHQTLNSTPELPLQRLRCMQSKASHLSPTAILLLLLRAFANDLSQLPLLGELAAKITEVFNEIFAGLNDGFFGRDFAVGLDAEFEGGEEWVRNLVGIRVGCGESKVGAYLVGGERDVWRLKKARTKHVAEGVVFFVEGEPRGGWDT